ncbi:MAG: NAD(P)/FAD-dependent oxidoreductase [Micromonosporaceae bacterium]|nr:NAD(P)/FAD-dependent oxidoreductase [Micromonosporaceae bacterium]
MDTDQPIVIVGAGLTGAKAAQALREEGFDGKVVLVGEETEQPYERPPLSKGYLLDKQDRGALRVHDEQWYDKHSVDLVLGQRATAIDRDTRRVRLQDGRQLRYSRLLLATGASPRRLDVPGADLDGVLYLRRVEDADRLADAIRGGGRVVVVGAGWIGLESAAAAREHGCQVTVIEPQPAPLHGALGPEMGGFFGQIHRQHGVDLRLGHTVAEIRGSGGRVTGVVTGDGSDVPTDVVIVGIGARPNTALAEQAGLPVDNGVLVDQSLRTPDANIYAAGDVANAFHPWYGQRIRVEHWANALNGGPAAANAMLGRDVVYDRLPYFFTDQYDVGMEFTGWFPPGGHDAVVTRGDVNGKAFYAFWLASGQVVAGMHVNRWDDGIAPVRELILAGQPADRDRLADPSAAL